MRPVIAFFSLLILASAANAGTLKLCNKGDIPLRLALIYEDRRGGSTAWVASGWTTVAPGCKELLKSSGNMQMYTSLVRAYKHIGNRIMHFKFSDTNDKQGTRATAKTVEAFYCVQAGKFERRLTKLREHADCPVNYHHQLFNKHIRIPSGIAYTLSITTASSQ